MQGWCINDVVTLRKVKSFGDIEMLRVIAVLTVMSATVFAQTPVLERAQSLYFHTNYQDSLGLLQAVPVKTGPVLELTGQNYFMLGEFKKATEAFEQAVSADPNNSEYVHWLGRAYGRRAETANPFLAPGFASKARQAFEKSVMLDPKNQEAMNDLFDYYLEAPGFLGGGLNKAQAIASRIADLDKAEGYFAQAQLAEQRKEFDTAEQHLRRALELAPRQVGRVLDLAKYLSKHGRIQESETVFAQAEKLAPNSPKVLFTRADTYIREKRNLDQAKSLLKRYLQAPLTPDDPPRQKAEELLKRAGA
jgi:tetratricopeptide (TPR) repeat protein